MQVTISGVEAKKEEHIIEVSHLSKSYGPVKAVEDISFYVEKGKLFAFLGPNGAGKSTTINSICTFLQPDKGTVFVNEYELGKNDDGIHKSIGTVFQESLLDEMLTVEENLMLRGSFYGMNKKELKEAVKRATRETELEEILKRPYGKLSGGQRRRCDIARALIHAPEILFLDEPTTGLDPQTRKSVWETIRRLQIEKGMTVFLTTHYMEEAEAADYCIVIDHGKIAAKGTPFELKDTYAKDKLVIKCRQGQQDTALAKIENYRKISRLHTDEGGMKKQNNADNVAERLVDVVLERKDGFLEIPLKNTKQALPVLGFLQEDIEDFTVTKGSMDDVFLAITGEEIRES